MNLLSSTFCILPTDEFLATRPDSIAAFEHLYEIASQQDRLLAHLLDPGRQVDLAARELAFVETVSAGLTLAEAARLAIALRIASVRDALWLRIDAGTTASWTLHVVPLLVGIYRTPPLFLYAWSCWRAGDLAVARRALHYALAADPGYSAGKLLASAIEGRVHPDNVPLLGSGASPSSILLQAVAR